MMAKTEKIIAAIIVAVILITTIVVMKEIDACIEEKGVLVRTLFWLDCI